MIKSHSKNKWITNRLQENVGLNLRNINKEPTIPEIYRHLNRAEQSFVAKARTGHFVPQSYLNR